jgi:hypothetical protein
MMLLRRMWCKESKVTLGSMLSITHLWSSGCSFMYPTEF